MNNARFGIATHFLTLLALAGDERTIQKYIAGSININSATVSEELSNLRKHGLIMSKEGTIGRNKLAKPAGHLRMSDIYQAVRTADLPGRNIAALNPECRVGKSVNGQLPGLYEAAEQSVLARFPKIFTR